MLHSSNIFVEHDSMILTFRVYGESISAERLAFVQKPTAGVGQLADELEFL
jgi:hypothetical protein